MALTRSDGGTLGTNQLLTGMLRGSPRYLGTVTSAGTAKNNSDTAVPFVITAGSYLYCETDADVQWIGVSTTTAVVTTTTGVLQDISLDGTHFTVFLTGAQAYLSVIGTAGVKVWAID